MPVAALALALRVSVLDPDPGAARVAGEKLAVTPLGMPVAVKATAESNAGAPATVSVTVVELPCTTLAALALSVRLNPGGGVTVTWSEVVCVTPPPFAVMVMDRVPAATLRLALSVNVLEPAPGAAREAGEKLAVIPPGSPLALSATAALKLLVPFTVTLAVPAPPCTNVTGPLVLSVNPGGGATVTVTGKTLVRPPPVAVTCSG